MLGNAMLRRYAGAAVLGLLSTVTACNSDEGPPDEIPIGQITLTIGNVTINSVGGNPPATAVVIPIGNNQAVTVTAETANGTAIALDPSEFELRIASSNNNVISYTKTSSLAGTMNAATAGTANLNVKLFHLIEEHVDYEILNLPVTVQ